MCTYLTAHVNTPDSSGKGPEGWFPLTEATVYYDHPVHAPLGHSLNIDFRNAERGPGARVAVELDAPAARALAETILATLDQAAGHVH